MTVAAVDIGTNSVRLLIVDQAGRELERQMRITRLGQGVDVSGRLAPDAIARTVLVLEEFRASMERWQVDRIRAAATSAARDAANRQQFFDAVTRALGVAPELLSGEEEARLSFHGATADLGPQRGPFAILDIGGGSTEIAFGTRAPEAFVSLQLGCVRMSERHLRSDPPTPEQLSACAADVVARLAGVEDVVGVRRARQVIGLAGTVSALSAMNLGLTHYDAQRTHHSALRRDQVARLFERLSQVNLAERRELLVEPERASVIVGGALVLLTILQELEIRELLVSEHDILDGLAASIR